MVLEFVTMALYYHSIFFGHFPWTR